MKEILFWFIFGHITGALNIWFLIRSYRKRIGSNPNPLAPDQVTEYYL